MTQCLFGEHLLTRYRERIVALVEAEKTAVIGAGFIPEYVWLATGGRSGVNDRVDILKNRKILVFADWLIRWKQAPDTMTLPADTPIQPIQQARLELVLNQLRQYWSEETVQAAAPLIEDLDTKQCRGFLYFGVSISDNSPSNYFGNFILFHFLIRIYIKKVKFVRISNATTQTHITP